MSIGALLFLSGSDELPQSASPRLGFPKSTQFRDGFIRPRSFPFHRSMAFTSKLITALIHPQQAATAVPSVVFDFFLIGLTWV